MADLEIFRAEVRDWLTKNAPRSIRDISARIPGSTNWGGRRATFVHPDMKVWMDMMAERGWTAPEWPKEYGGGGLSKAEAKILQEEITALKLPMPLAGAGVAMIGPTLLQFGTEEQRREHLPKIVRGEINWCQGYSEPGAGSDLASLQTKAVRQGDHFVVNGQKIWTTHAHLADWMFMLVRTDPTATKHEGITFLLTDMEAPGVEVRPIKLISGVSHFCETFLTDVQVPVKNVVGKVNEGWTIAKALLGHERTMAADMFAGGARKERTIREWGRAYLDWEDGHIADATLRQRMAAYEMDSRAFQLTKGRSRDNAKAGRLPGAESSIFKIYGTEMNQRRCELLLAIAGPQALGWDGAGFEKKELDLTREWLRSRGNTIEGGTSEIQLNIIAKRVLGLPD